MLRSCSPGIPPKSRVPGGKRQVRSFCVFIMPTGCLGMHLLISVCLWQVAEPADDIEDLTVLYSHLHSRVPHLGCS